MEEKQKIRNFVQSFINRVDEEERKEEKEEQNEKEEKKSIEHL